MVGGKASISCSGVNVTLKPSSNPLYRSFLSQGQIPALKSQFLAVSKVQFTFYTHTHSCPYAGLACRAATKESHSCLSCANQQQRKRIVCILVKRNNKVFFLFLISMSYRQMPPNIQLN